jgi:hypothetical protein
MSCPKHAVGFKFTAQRVGIFDPDIGVPGFAIGIDQTVGTHHTRLGELAKHDNDPAATDHAKAGRLAPKPFVVESQLVAVEIGGEHYIVNDEVRCYVPAHLICH